MATAAPVETTAQVAERVLDKVMDKSGDFVNAAAATAGNVFEAASNIITTAVTKYGQSVVDAVLWVVRLDAIQTLVTAYLLLIATCLATYWVWTGFTRRDWARRIDRASDNVLYMPLAVFVACNSLVMVGSIIEVTKVWTYVAVAKPELYLAKQAVDVVKAKLSPPSSKSR